MKQSTAIGHPATGIDLGADRKRPALTSVQSRKMTTDFATIIGLGGAFGLIATAVILGGSPQAFFNAPALLIVIGGTFATTTICFSLSDVYGSQKVILRTIFYPVTDPAAAAIRILHLAETARKQGVLHLQEILPSLAGESFLCHALRMVIDGFPAEDVEKILHRDLEATRARHIKSASVLHKAAEVSPAMGLIGTLVGLVQMLSRLDEPSTIGPSMAVALLTTFYGAVLANLVFSPLASKLERNSREEALVDQIYLMGALSIGRQENPRRLEMLLNSLLPPDQRIKYFD